MKRFVSCFLVCLTGLLCGCGQKPAGPKEKAIAIPADSFLLSVEHQPGPAVSAPSEIKITVTLERSPAAKSEVFKPLLLEVGLSNTGDLVGAAPKNVAEHQIVKKDPPYSFDPDRKKLIAIIVNTYQKEGTTDWFLRFRMEIDNEPYPLETSRPLLRGESLADVLKVDVQHGLYKIGSPVHLGSVRYYPDQTKTFTISLQVH